MSRRKIVFDSYAVLALLEDEAGAQVVAEIIASEAVEIFLSVISLGEVYYIISRRRSEQAVEETVCKIMQEEFLNIADASWTRVRSAARIKAGGGLSYADAFVLGLSLELGAPVVTGDPEIRKAAEKLGLKVIWIGS